MNCEYPIQEEVVRLPVPEPANAHPTDPAAVVVEQPQPQAHLTQTRVEAGRKGGHRVHQLIAEGRLYEKEHGLKRGRQRLRQLAELGRLYEHEHGLAPQRAKSDRLSRMERTELMRTLFDCLVRIAKPSFRAEIGGLAAALEQGHDANV